jgi:hypothetical protein
MADKAQPVHMLLDHELLSRIDDFRFAQRFESRTAAIKWLLNWALSKNRFGSWISSRFPAMPR